MTRFELLAIALILVLGCGGAWLGYRHFGLAGYVAGFISGALLLPVGIAVTLKILKRNRRRSQ